MQASGCCMSEAFKIQENARVLAAKRMEAVTQKEHAAERMLAEAKVVKSVPYCVLDCVL